MSSLVIVVRRFVLHEDGGLIADPCASSVELEVLLGFFLGHALVNKALYGFGARVDSDGSVELSANADKGGFESGGELDGLIVAENSFDAVMDAHGFRMRCQIFSAMWWRMSLASPSV